MSNTKKTSATPIVRFSVGAVEIAAADAWRESAGAERLSARAVFDLLFGDVDKGGHGVTLAALMPRAEGAGPRSNEEAAALDFARRFHAVLFAGAECAAMLWDKNIPADAKVQRAGLKSTGVPYAVQEKRKLYQTMTGKEWPVFVKRMAEMAAGVELDAKLASGEMSEADAEAAKRGAKSTKPEMFRVIEKANELIKLLRKPIDKRDGSIDFEVAAKFAKYIVDGMTAYGIK